MSTGKRNIVSQAARFSQLASLGEVVFHVDDLANLWQIRSRNNLHTTLKRYAQKKLLFRIYKGFYSIKPVNQISPELLGARALHTYGYISAETVLREAGIIQQQTSCLTLISSKSKRFSIGKNNYYCRKLSNKYLFNSTGITEIDGIRKASVERSVADLLYFNPRAFFDAERSIKWDKVKRIQKEIGYPATPNRNKKRL